MNKKDVENKRGKQFNTRKQNTKGPEKRQFEQKSSNVKDNKKEKGKSSCKISDLCGGCQYLDVAYEQELKLKNQRAKELFRGLKDPEPIIGMKNPLYYRNKVHAALHRKKDGTVVAGVYEEKTHHVLPVQHCFVENQDAALIIQDVAKLLKDFKIKIYNEDTGYGLVRHLLVRVATHTKEIMLTIVTADPIFPSKNNFVKAVRKLHPEITTIVQNINTKQTSMVLGQREQVLFGKGYIEDTLMGKRFRISSQSFYQVNSEQTEALYSKALELAGLNKDMAVLDAYCGTGTIGILAADHVHEVIGVELNPDAVRDAKTNAKINQTSNISFYCNDAGKFLVELKEQGKTPDLVIMDPPRSGSSEVFLNTLLQVEPEKIVYVSCGPETLVRDLKILKKKYQIKKICPVDMFPKTGHVETVVLLSR